MIEVTATGEIDTIIIVPGPGMDWLGAVFRKDADSPWEIQYRFRYHDPSGDDDKDEKSWYRIVPGDQSVDLMANALWRVAHALRDTGAWGEPDRVIIKGGVEEMRRALADREWASVRTETAG